MYMIRFNPGFVAALVLGLASCGLANAEWTTGAGMPTPRQEIYADTANGMIYVPGGILVDGSSFTDAFERYDASADTWTKLAPLPAARHHITPAVVGDQIYAIGGFEGPFPNWIMKADVFVYGIAEDTWRDGIPLPSPQGEHVQAVVDGRIYIIGGRIPMHVDAGNFHEYIDTTRHWMFDPAVGRWQERKSASIARNSAAAAVIDGEIYVVGGRQNLFQDDGSQLQHNVTELEIYDPRTDSWRRAAPMPLAQGGLAAAAVNGKLYAFGGEQWTDEKQVFDEAWEYDPETDSWSALPSLPTQRHGLTAAAIDGRIYVIGGCTKLGGGAAVGTVEILAP
jgi:N-acetylneuraminic acid mutarotase